MSNSAYWTQNGPDGYEYKVRECKNDGCAEIVYYDENSGRFAELESGETHDCPYYKRNNTSQKSPGQRPPQQQQSQAPKQQDQSTSHIQKIEEYSLTQVEELQRLTALLLETKNNTGHLDLISQYLRRIGDSLTTQERILEQILTEIQKQEPHVEGPQL